MTPAEALEDHRMLINATGEEITLRRETKAAGNPPVMIPFDASVRARVMQYKPEQLVGGIDQGARRLIVLAEDLQTASWPGDPRKGDLAIVRGQTLKVSAVDANTRRIQGVLIAYELTATGA